MYEQTLYSVIEPIKINTIKRLNKAKKWKYGYNKENDVIVISKTGQIGDVYTNNIDQTLIIQPGMSLEKISNLLKQKDIISNKLLFKLWVKFNALEKKLKFGEYRIPNSISIINLIEIFLRGQSVNYFIAFFFFFTDYVIGIIIYRILLFFSNK